MAPGQCLLCPLSRVQKGEAEKGKLRVLSPLERDMKQGSLLGHFRKKYLQSFPWLPTGEGEAE